MSLLIILLIGANIGWLASIVMLTDRPREVLLNVVLGVLGAFFCGVMASSVSLLEGITPVTLVAAAVGAAALLTIAHLAIDRHALAGCRAQARGGRDGVGRLDSAP